MITKILISSLAIVFLSGCASPSKYYQNASAEMGKGDFSKALLDYGNAIKLKPDYVEAYIGRGEAKFKLGDLNGALADYKKAAELKPDLVSTLGLAPTLHAIETNEITTQAIALIQARDYEKLDELASKFRSSNDCYPNGVLKLAFVYDALVPSDHAPDFDWDARLDAIGRWAVARPESITARVAWANVLVSYAWKARGAGETDTVSPGGWKLFFVRLAEARKILTDAKFVIDECPIYWRVMMRDALGLEMHRTQFDALFERAIKFEPNCETYYYRRAIYFLPQWYGTNGEWQIDLAKVTDKIGGQDGDMIYAQVIWNMHRDYGEKPFEKDYVSWERVDKGFEVIEKRFPDSLAAKIGRVNLAILANDAHANVVFNRAKEKEAKGDLIGAMNEYKEAIEIKPDYVYAYVHLGILHKQKGDFKGAMAYFDKAVELDPGYSTAYYNRGVNKQFAGDFDGAMSDYNKAIDLRPDYALAYLARGQLKQIKGDNSGGNTDMQQGFKLQNSGK